MERLARFVIRRRGIVIGIWLVLTIFGAYSAARVSDRWLEQFSIPGYSAYEANQRALKTFGSGEQPPSVAVFVSKGDVTKTKEIGPLVERVAARYPGVRSASYFSTGSPAYVSK